MTTWHWVDYWRLLNAVACVTCLIVLLHRFRRFGRTYNEKTRDYWYSLFMWSLAGFVGSLMSIFLNSPTNPGLVITTAAAIVSLKGMLNQGQWGGDR